MLSRLTSLVLATREIRATTHLIERSFVESNAEPVA